MAKTKSQKRAKVTQDPERIEEAQRRANSFREASKSRTLTVPDNAGPDAKPLHDFTVESDGLAPLHLIAEDEGEAIRQARICHGVDDTRTTFRVSYRGNDPRPRPQTAAPSI